MKREDLERVVYAQGWIANQMNQFVPPAEEATVFAQWREMWAALDKGIDELVKDSQKLDEVEQKLLAIKALTRTSVEQKLDEIANILS